MRVFVRRLRLYSLCVWHALKAVRKRKKFDLWYHSCEEALCEHVAELREGDDASRLDVCGRLVQRRRWRAVGKRGVTCGASVNACAVNACAATADTNTKPVLKPFQKSRPFSANPVWYDYQLRYSYHGLEKTQVSFFLFGFDDKLLVTTDDDIAQSSDPDTHSTNTDSQSTDPETHIRGPDA